MHIVFPPPQWLHERASILRYTYIARLFVYFPFSLLNFHFTNSQHPVTHHLRDGHMPHLKSPVTVVFPPTEYV
jgi:hypothetical protein